MTLEATKSLDDKDTLSMPSLSRFGGPGRVATCLSRLV